MEKEVVKKAFSFSFFLSFFFFFSLLFQWRFDPQKKLLFFYNRYLMIPKCPLGFGFVCSQVSNLGHSLTALPGKACHWILQEWLISLQVSFHWKRNFLPTIANRSLNNTFYPMSETAFLGTCTACSRTTSRLLGTLNFLGLRRTFSVLFFYT